MQLMRDRIPAAVVPVLAGELGVTQEKLLHHLHLSASTVKRRISQNTSLSSLEQDRIYRATRILERATQVLDDEVSAQKWVLQDIRSLGGECPLSLLDTAAGYECVLDTLGRIEYGIPA